jgi:hypothetical protein
MDESGSLTRCTNMDVEIFAGKKRVFFSRRAIRFVFKAATRL